MSGVIRWEEPPGHYTPAGRPIGGGHSRWDGVADELRTREGEWALISEESLPGSNRGLATQIRMGQMICFSPAGDFDAEARARDGIRRVWARYVGGEPE